MKKMLINPTNIKDNKSKAKSKIENFSFKLVEKKRRHFYTPREYFRGLCFRDENNDIKIRLTDGRILDFDEESDITKGQKIVFSKIFSEYGKPYKIIRTAEHAEFNPGVQYTIIAIDYNYEGYIKNGKFFITKLLERKNMR